MISHFSQCHLQFQLFTQYKLQSNQKTRSLKEQVKVAKETIKEKIAEKKAVRNK